jgi:DNA-binding transcriptional LysR family regulator
MPAIATKRLVRVLPEWSTGERPVFVVFASNRHVPARVRALVDFAVKNADLVIHGQQQRKPVELPV